METSVEKGVNNAGKMNQIMKIYKFYWGIVL